MGLIPYPLKIALPMASRRGHAGKFASAGSASKGHSVSANDRRQNSLDASAKVIDRNRTEKQPGKQQRTERELRDTKDQLRAILETAVDSIITIDERGVIRSVNPATTRMFGYSTKQMVGQNINMLMPSPYREEHDGYIARYVKTGKKRIIGIGREVQGQRQDGTTFPVDLAVSEVEPGKLFTGVIRDISDRKTSEARLREADRMASIGALAAGLGHDMNNVLLPVRAHLNALKSNQVAPPNRLKHLDQIHSGVCYLQQLADGLHFLAMDPDKEDVAGGVTNLQSWWQQTGALLRKAVPRHVKVISSFANVLPEVSIAPHALTQAVLNLIVNAGEAIPAGRKRRQGYVRLTAEQVNRAGETFVRLSIADNGTGMTDEVKRRAFDMFFTTKPRGLGTGLGLAMVRKVVDRARGSIEIDSAVGRGTTFSLFLPAVTAAQDFRKLTGAVRVRDGRAASLIRNLLEVSGVAINHGSDARNANIWVVDPLQSNFVQTSAWRKHQPSGRLVLFGRPDDGSADAWHDMKPTIIDEPTDLESVRTAIGVAMSEI